MKHTHLPHWHRGLHAIHFGFVSGLIVVTFMASIGLSVLSPQWVRQADAAVTSFSGSSFWNTPVPAYTDLHGSSDQLTASIVQQVGQYGTAFIKDTSAPVYVAEAGTPSVTVIPWDCGAGSMPDLANQWQSVPIPFFAVPSGSGQMIVHQPSSSTVWEFGHMQNVAGQWQACTGGRISTASDGVFPAPYGISASGLAGLAGQLTSDELRSGYIDHVIGLHLPRTNGFVSPATQTNSSQAGAPAMGMRFRLDPSVNIQALGLSEVGLAIARAAQTYGFIVWNGGGTVGISAENPISKTSRGIADPYSSIPGFSTALANFPWSKLQALPSGGNYATAIPAITQLTISPATVKADSRATLTWRSDNVNRCAIPGIGDNLPANGSSQTLPLKTDTTFVLRCGGPAGTASSQVSVTVSATVQNDPMPQPDPAIIIDVPYSGYANVMPDLMSSEAAKSVYKVVYYEAEMYLFETAKTPYALNTSRMNNGKHTIDAQIYHRDGRTERKTIGITVNNSPETLFATVQSGTITAPPSVPLPYALVGVVLALAGMAAGSWWGWRKAHLT